MSTLKKTTVSSVEEGHDLLKKFIADSSTVYGYDYAHLLQLPDETLVVEARTGAPCYGELRKYKGGTRPWDPHPGDLPHPLGQGKVLGVSVMTNTSRNSDEGRNLALNTVFEPTRGPWRSVFSSGVPIVNKVGRLGIFLGDTNFDSTVMVSAFMCLRSAHANRFDFASKMSNDMHPALRFLLAVGYFYNGEYKVGDSYQLHGSWNAKKFFEGDYNPLSNGTYFDNFDYNRPFLHFLFSEEVNPKNYPNAYDVSKAHHSEQYTLNSSIPTNKDGSILVMMRDTIKAFTKSAADEKVIQEAILANQKEFESAVQDRL